MIPWVLFLQRTLEMRLLPCLLACFVACTAPVDEGDLDSEGGKDDRGTSSRFVEVDPTHTNPTFRTYVHRALDKLAADGSELARATLDSIRAAKVRIDELADLTCADFLRVAKDLPDLALRPADHAKLKARGSDTTAAISDQLDGYMWSNRIYISRGQTPQRLAATLIHEVNHVINRSEVGYYDDLPTSAFLHEYRAFYLEAQFDPGYYEGVNLVDYVIESYELDRSKIRPEVLADPLTPRLVPNTTAWRERRVERDVEQPASCE
jgi:hypothetical protein